MRAVSHGANFEEEPQYSSNGYASLPTDMNGYTVGKTTSRGGKGPQTRLEPEIGTPGSRAVAEVMDSTWYQVLSAVVILANAVVIGFETDFPDVCSWDTIENLFLLYFTIEVAFRVYAVTPSRFFSYAATGSDVFWNALDTVIIGFGLSDTVVSLFEKPSEHPDHHHERNSFATLFRIVRLLRILRVFKIIRFLKELYLLVYGFIDGLQAVFWVTLLMTGALYLCSIVLVRSYTHLAEPDDPAYEMLQAKFSTVPVTMFTLFEIMSNPDLTHYHELLRLRPGLLLFFITFIIFGSFGLIALLTGVISESMFEKNQAKIEHEHHEKDLRRLALHKSFGDLFDQVDSNANMNVEVPELEANKEKIRDLLVQEGADFTMGDLDHMFSIFDQDASGRVDRDEFINSCIALCGNVRPTSIMELNSEVALVRRSTQRIDLKLDQLTGAIDHLTREVSALKAGTFGGSVRYGA